MITPVSHVCEKIFKLDLPIEELQPRQSMLLKRRILDILVEWRKEHDIAFVKALKAKDETINRLETELGLLKKCARSLSN